MTYPIKIALADDHALMRQGLVLLISSFTDMRVIIDVKDGQELIDNCITTQLPDICLLDVRMPVLNGYETLVQLKKKWPEVKTLILTTYDNELNTLRFIHAGADGYITKGCNPVELEKAIRSIHGGGMYYPTELLQKISSAISDKTAKKFLSITDGEFEFLRLCCTELTLKEIASRMSTNLRTIEGYRDSLFKKLNLRSRVGLASYVLESGINHDLLSA